jgi:hypothetical protein
VLPVGAGPNITGQLFLTAGTVLLFCWMVILLVCPRSVAAVHLLFILGVVAFAKGIRQAAP